MEEFKREHRYNVIKLKTGKLVDCVVVESDWPEYETVWELIQDRMEGRPNTIESQAARIKELEDRVLRMIRHDFNQICGYCGWESVGENNWEKLQEHVAICKDHPLGKANFRIKELEAEVERLRKVES